MGTFGSSSGVVGHEPIVQGSWGAMPARSNMIMVMEFSGSCNARAAERILPEAASVVGRWGGSGCRNRFLRRGRRPGRAAAGAGGGGPGGGRRLQFRHNEQHIGG